MPSVLTVRQQQCLSLSATLHDQQIADALGISVHTVRQHIAEAKGRLGVNDRKAARRLLPQDEGGHFQGIVEQAGERSAGLVATGSDADPRRPNASSGMLLSAYAGLGKWRTPPRWKGKRIGPIVLTALVFVVLLGLISQSLRSCVELVDVVRARPLETHGVSRDRN